MISKKPTILKRTLDNGDFRSMQSLQEISKGISELSPLAFKMLGYLYTKSDNWKFNNKDFQNKLGVAESTVKKLLRELKDKKYFHESKGETTVYYIGLSAVKKYVGDTE